VKATKVFLLEPNAEERNLLGKVVRELKAASMPIAARILGIILLKIDAGEYLTSREVEDVRVWLDCYGARSDMAKRMNNSLWAIVR
jgi:hypothetical protein